MSELFAKDTPLATGFDDIDAEHARLHVKAKRIAALFAVENGDRDAALKELKGFVDAVAQHFHHEEQYFKALDPDRAREHIKQHDLLHMSLKLFAKDVEDLKKFDTWGYFIDLEDVLLKHIILYDQDLKRVSKP